jgi:predicted O-methyltransferase YrrM
MNIAFRPFYGTVDEDQAVSPKLKHPFFAFSGIRPLASQHSKSEDQIIRKYAAMAGKVLVEIGVAEGGSAVSLRECMPPDAYLYLIDPFLSGRIPLINMDFLVAQKAVNKIQNGSVVWIKDFSFKAVQTWEHNGGIDLLFIDGDHSETGCMKDWIDWSPLIKVGGFVIFHDARLFPGGWTNEEDGPVKVVNQLFKVEGVPLPNWEIIEEVDSLVVAKRLS